ncbi:MAG TPA: anhydro-N-acetylmuramic acid kinase [Chitinophagales bacterium]|nr:anhydro-N-acetylmuramic acid kinase [Chitinophagales bacterium]
MLQNKTVYGIGLMSGSSLDGLDICYVKFEQQKSSICYTILQATCIAYDKQQTEKLRKAAQLTAFEFAALHTEMGKFFGSLTHQFIQQHQIEKLDFIASHGQTIFHQVATGFTTQIGCGAQIAAQTGHKVVCDLRTADVAYGGQGAPIVPIAEKYLFPDFSFFLNIGGIANIAIHNKEKTTIHAYDICAGNTMLNYLAKQKNLDFDDNGNLARNGKVINELLEKLNAIPFCKQAAPKSLGTEHIYETWIPLFDECDSTIEDKLATAVEHIAMQVGKEINNLIPHHNSSLFITGGGALNTYLIERIQQHTTYKTIVPDMLTVQYKEALAMAFFGLLRIIEQPNCLASVTGAQKNVIGGAVYLP